MTAVELLASVRTKADCKRVGAMLDRQPDLKPGILELARSRGVELPDDAISWPGKRLLRRARGLAQSSQVRTNPIHRDEDFNCAHCGRDVHAHGRTARDHCPYCLRGLHVDAEVPGDRASTCGSVLHPVGVERTRSRWVLRYECAGCGATRRNQVIQDGDPPDDWAAVVALQAPA